MGLSDSSTGDGCLTIPLVVVDSRGLHGLLKSVSLHWLGLSLRRCTAFLYCETQASDQCTRLSTTVVTEPWKWQTGPPLGGQNMKLMESLASQRESGSAGVGAPWNRLWQHDRMDVFFMMTERKSTWQTEVVKRIQGCSQTSAFYFNMEFEDLKKKNVNFRLFTCLFLLSTLERYPEFSN